MKITFHKLLLSLMCVKVHMCIKLYATVAVIQKKANVKGLMSIIVYHL